MIVVSGAAAYAALISRIVVDPPSVRIVNPWGARTLQIADIVAVEPAASESSSCRQVVGGMSPSRFNAPRGHHDGPMWPSP